MTLLVELAGGEGGGSVSMGEWAGYHLGEKERYYLGVSPGGGGAGGYHLRNITRRRETPWSVVSVTFGYHRGGGGWGEVGGICLE